MNAATAEVNVTPTNSPISDLVKIDALGRGHRPDGKFLSYKEVSMIEANQDVILGGLNTLGTDQAPAVINTIAAAASPAEVTAAATPNTAAVSGNVAPIAAAVEVDQPNAETGQVVAVAAGVGGAAVGRSGFLRRAAQMATQPFANVRNNARNAANNAGEKWYKLSGRTRKAIGALALVGSSVGMSLFGGVLGTGAEAKPVAAVVRAVGNVDAQLGPEAPQLSDQAKLEAANNQGLESVNLKPENVKLAGLDEDLGPIEAGKASLNRGLGWDKYAHTQRGAGQLGADLGSGKAPFDATDVQIVHAAVTSKDVPKEIQDKLDKNDFSGILAKVYKIKSSKVTYHGIAYQLTKEDGSRVLDFDPNREVDGPDDAIVVISYKTANGEFKSFVSRVDCSGFWQVFDTVTIEEETPPAPQQTTTSTTSTSVPASSTTTSVPASSTTSTSSTSSTTTTLPRTTTSTSTTSTTKPAPTTTTTVPASSTTTTSSTSTTSTSTTLPRSTTTTSTTLPNKEPGHDQEGNQGSPNVSPGSGGSPSPTGTTSTTSTTRVPEAPGATTTTTIIVPPTSVPPVIFQG